MVKKFKSQQGKLGHGKHHTLRCSLCKATGHNKRTCKSSKNVTKQKPAKLPRGYTKPGTPFSGTKTRGGSFVNELNSSLNSLKDRETSDTQGDLSAEEVMVWWNLVKPNEERNYLPALSNFLKSIPTRLTPEVSEKLREEIIEDLPRSHIASFVRDTDTPFKFAELLAEKYDLKEELVHHQSKEMPVGLLKTMMNHESHIVRCAVARHPNTTQDMLVRMFQDKHARVRRTVIKNFRTPNHVVQKAVGDRSKEVANVAREKIVVRKKVGMLR